MQQAFFAVNQPTRSAVLPKMVEPHLLPAANSLNMTVAMAGGIAGPLVAGILIPVIGFEWLYLIDTFTLFATLGAVVRLPRLPVLDAAAGAPGVRAVVDGFRYLRTQPVLMMSFVVDLIAMVFGMPRALFPEIAHVDFGGPENGGIVFALLFAAIPAGAVIGGVFSGWVSHVEHQGRAVVVSIALWGLAMTGFGVAVALADQWRTPMLVVALLMLVLGGAADMASAAFRMSMLQSAADDALRGRLQGVFIVVVAGGRASPTPCTARLRPPSARRRLLPAAACWSSWASCSCRCSCRRSSATASAGSCGADPYGSGGRVPPPGPILSGWPGHAYAASSRPSRSSAGSSRS